MVTYLEWLWNKRIFALGSSDYDRKSIVYFQPLSCFSSFRHKIITFIVATILWAQSIIDEEQAKLFKKYSLML